MVCRLLDPVLQTEFQTVKFVGIKADLKRDYNFIQNSSKNGLSFLVKRYFFGMLRVLIDYPGINAFFETYKTLKKLKGNSFDCCLSIDGPQEMHWAVTLARRKKIISVGKFIADCGDPLTRNLPGFMIAPYFKIIEDWFCRNADRITVPVAEGFSYFKPEFKSKINVVKHSLEFPEQTEIKKVPDEDGIVQFAYAGNLMPYQKQLNILLTFLSQYNFNYCFHIYGNDDSVIDNLVGSSYPKQIDFINHGKKKRFQLLVELSRYDFLIYFLYPETTGQIPFKLIDYSFTGLPAVGIRGKSDLRVFSEFLSGNYENGRELPDFREYHYSLTVNEYESLFLTE